MFTGNLGPQIWWPLKLSLLSNSTFWRKQSVTTVTSWATSIWMPIWVIELIIHVKPPSAFKWFCNWKQTGTNSRLFHMVPQHKWSKKRVITWPCLCEQPCNYGKCKIWNPTFGDHVLIIVNVNLRATCLVETHQKRDWHFYSTVKIDAAILLA